MIYITDDKVEQHINQKINEGYAFPERFRIVKAKLYTFNPIKREKPWKDGTGNYSDKWTFQTWLEVWDSEGNFGTGPVTPEVVKLFLPMLLKDKEMRTNLEWRKIFYWRVRGAVQSLGSIAQLEMIFFDLIARKRGIPVHRLLGATRDWCACYKGGGSVLRTDEELVEEILSIRDEGFLGTKMKMSLNEVERDIRRVELVRKAVGDDFFIAVDSNQAWDAETCMKFARATKDLKLAWYEEPIMAFEMEEIRSLVDQLDAEGIDLPLAYGESAKHFETYKAYIDAGVKVIQPFPMTYTLAETIRIADYARERGCKISTGQGYHPGVLVGTLLREDEMIEFHGPNSFCWSDYYSICAELKDGKMFLPNKPGLPVEVDYEKLESIGALAGIQYFYAKQ